MATDTSERGLERLICTALTGHPCDPPKAGTVEEVHPGYGGVGWSCGSPQDYDREFCVDQVQLAAFLRDTQPEAAESLALDTDGPTQRKFLARLQGAISKRGTIDVLRHGVRHGAHDLNLFYGTPSAENEKAKQRFEQNRFTVVRQLRYSRDETQRALDIGLFINGLPIVVFQFVSVDFTKLFHELVRSLFELVHYCRRELRPGKGPVEPYVSVKLATVTLSCSSELIQKIPRPSIGII